MASIATCKFPLVDQFKDYGEKNGVVGFIDSVLSGFGQIVLSDNPVSGLLIMLGVYIAAPSQMLTALFAACVATAFAYLLGVNKFLIHHGYYTFSAAVCGLGVSLWGYNVQAVYPQVLICAGIAAVISVVLVASFGALFAKWDAPALAVPYCVTLMVVIPALLLMNHMAPQPLLVPALTEVTNAPMALNAETFMTATISGIAEICFQFKVASGICLLLALFVSSRIDAAVAVICSAVGTGIALAVGLPEVNIAIGLYGYNAVLVGIGLFGRAFRMSVASALYTLAMVVFSVFLTVAMGVIFAPLGIPVAALPFAVIVIVSIMSKDLFTKLTPVSYLLWGVPETIEKALKAEDAKAQ